LSFLKIKKKKKTLRDEFNMDIRDMIVKKRIASLNASAIMSASYSFSQNDKMKTNPLLNELGVITNSRVGESAANNYDVSTNNMPKHLTTALSKIDEGTTSTLATALVSNRTTTSTPLSMKPQLPGSSIFKESNRNERDQLAKTLKRPTTETKNMSKHLQRLDDNVDKKGQQRMQKKELKKHKQEEKS
jgi:hypothetical protein